MTPRSTRASVTFAFPFRLSVVDGLQPAGSYVVETDEMPIESLSFKAYQRTDTRIYIPLHPGSKVSMQSISIDPRELELCLERDRAAQPEADSAPAAR